MILLFFLLHLTIFTGKVLDSYILDGDLLQEVRTLAAGVTSDDAFPSQPVTEPSQVTVTVKRIGQKVSGDKKRGNEGAQQFYSFFAFTLSHIWALYCLYSQRGQRVQRVEGSGVHGRNLVVIEGQKTH